MSLLNAPEYDPVRERRRTIRIVSVIVLVLVTIIVVWVNRFWPEEHKADKFFSAIVRKNFEQAYGLWMSDPRWQQHPEKYPKYKFGEFYRDWGPGSEWGQIKAYKIAGAGECHGGGGSGVVVKVIVNDRATPTMVWVEKGDKSMSFPPCEPDQDFIIGQ